MNNFEVISPSTTEALLKAIHTNLDKKFRFGAGYTDLILELKQQPEADLLIINLAKLKDDSFTTITQSNQTIRIGALVSAAKIISDKKLQTHFPVLGKSANLVGSRQLRQMATIGGNLCTASPAGDMVAALTALQAHCEILSPDGTVRSISISEFMVGVRKTALRPGEILRNVALEINNDRHVLSDFIKVGVRRSMEIAVVSLACQLHADEKNKISFAGVALGSVAPTVRFAESACEYLLGKKFSAIKPDEAQTFADKVLQVASPISDLRASEWYRREVLHNISRSIFEN